MRERSICIYCEAAEMQHGLFGQVFLHFFELLPYLHARSIFPAWEIRSTFYGAPPDFITIPGVLDLAYPPPPAPYRRVHMRDLRAKHCQVLGNDWAELSRIWHAYFKIPDRVIQQADSLPSLDKALGVHYRGTDKQTTSDDSNPITHDQYLTLLVEFLSTRPVIERVFAATDEYTFVDKLRSAVNLPIVNLGEVGFHKAATNIDPRIKADRAVLDCLLLSRCCITIETSSALPSFAKIFNPGLELYRCAASKLFADIPYFPVAYVPQISLTSLEALNILKSTMANDWTTNPKCQSFKAPFSYAPRNPVKSRLWEIAERLTGK
jgi:hypothetical protein